MCNIDSFERYRQRFDRLGRLGGRDRVDFIDKLAVEQGDWFCRLRGYAIYHLWGVANIIVFITRVDRFR